MQHYDSVIRITAINLLLLFALLAPNAAASQKVVLRVDKVSGVTHISKEDFPKDMLINRVNGWGGMAVAINEIKAGTDFTPLLQGLEDDLCQVPHWGYLEKGKIRFIDVANNSETVLAGEVFYMPPGHTLIVDEDARIIDFSPEKQMNELNEFLTKKIEGMKPENR